MDKLNAYRAHIQEVIKRYGNRKPLLAEDEAQIIFDREHDHYQLVHAGWHHDRRMYGCIIHMNLRNGKIWIQHDGTETGVANELVALGVPQDDIVLAFQAPYKRQYSGFAVN